MRLYAQTSPRTAVSMPFWLAVPAYLVWLLLVLTALFYAGVVWVVIYCVRAARAWSAGR